MKKIFNILLTGLITIVLSGCITPKVSYDVHFNSNGGTEIASISAVEGTSILEPSVPELEGHTLLGWYTDTTLNVVFDFSSAINGETSLHAKWEINDYEISFDNDGGSITDTITAEYESQVTIPEDPTKENMMFIGWYLDDEFNELFDFASMPSQDLTLYAKWDMLYTISFEENGGYQEENIHYLAGSDILTIYDGMKVGYSFIDWYTDEALTLPFDLTVMPENNITLYALWEINQYTITLYDIDDIELETYTFDFNDNIEIIYDYDLGLEEEIDLAYDNLFRDQFSSLLMPSTDLELFVREKPEYETLDVNTQGQIDIMFWSGSGYYYEDIGHSTLDVADLISQNEAAAYYVAKEFNSIYPNVVINVKGLTGGPNDGGKIWEQELYVYQQEFGVHPSIWMTDDLPRDVQRGIAADLSRFVEDPLYQTMNPAILNMMNYYGFQAGLPSYILPWGIYVNKELASDHSITVPGPNWTIEEYTALQGNSLDNVYYGSMDTPLRIIETGVNTISKQLSEYNGSGDYVNLNSSEVQSLIPYLETWNDNSIWGSNASMEFMNTGGFWGYSFFQKNLILTYEGDPWMMGDCAVPNQSWWAACESTDWDIYPRPSTDYVDNTVGIVLDPIVVYNSCLDDGNLSCSVEEELKIKLNYTFASFWTADSRSWTARAEGMFTDYSSGTMSSSLTDSFPITVGDAFDEQMDIWYTPLKHQRFSDDTVMPGFHEVIRIYEEGQFWDVSDKAYPYYHNYDGQRVNNLFEWNRYWDSDVNGGFTKGDPGFVDGILGNLNAWNIAANNNFDESFHDLEMALKIFYGYTNEDFN